MPKQPDSGVPTPAIGDLDLHLAAEGRHEALYNILGAHVFKGPAVGVRFAVWAPNARAVSVVGDFNHWDGGADPMRCLGDSGIWERFVSGLASGSLYRYELQLADGSRHLRSDPFAFAAEKRPSVASVTADLDAYAWGDDNWMSKRPGMTGGRPVSIYELHLGSWMRHAPDNRWYTYRETADRLVDYILDMGFTHVEFMPLMEHPLDASWGYQVTGYFAATSRFGPPQDLMHLIDRLHQAGIGVILDWVPAHFPRDDFALAGFDGTALYEHGDPRQGLHPDWDTLIFNYGRNEVRNFLMASALFWLDRYHADGLRVDAVASMLYLDYGREEGDWIPNPDGGRENLKAVSFLQELNSVVHRRFPGTLMIAEESTAWPGVTHDTKEGGLEFDLKWNMGFMHDSLTYFSSDPIYRRHMQEKLTFGLMYAFNERFLLPFSHDEVVHGKSSLLGKMPGDDWQKFANLRTLFAFQFAHPGKKLLFMGSELAPWREWSETQELEWELLRHPPHAGMHSLVSELARLYRREPSLWECDHAPEGFKWIDFADEDQNVVSWIRYSAARKSWMVCVFNLSPMVRPHYRIGVPSAAAYDLVLDSDGEKFGGSGAVESARAEVEAVPAHGWGQSIAPKLPPLAGLYFKPASS